jgi:hypothetical protein
MSKPVKLSVGDKVEIKFDFPYGQDFGFYKWTGERIVFTVVDLGRKSLRKLCGKPAKEDK